MDDAIETPRISLDDKQLSLDEIEILRSEGAIKPETISDSIWEGPKDFFMKSHPACYLAAFGMRANDIAKELSLSVQKIQMLLNKDHIKVEVKDLERKYASSNIKTKIQALLPESVEVLEEIMMNENARHGDRINAASIIQDRGLGKPKQELDVGISLIREVFEKMDQRAIKREKPSDLIIIDSTVNSKEEAEVRKLVAPKDSVDTWIDQNLGEK